LKDDNNNTGQQFLKSFASQKVSADFDRYLACIHKNSFGFIASRRSSEKKTVYRQYHV